jgi:dTDP-glucose 4,6-dehydratase
LSGKTSLNLGNLKPTRDLNFVFDTVDGFINIAKTNKLNGEITNVGNGSEISIKALALEIARLCKVEIKLEISEERKRPAKSEVNRLFCDNSKIIKMTEWRPQYSLEQGLIQTIDWIKQNINYYKPDLYIK